MNLVDNSLDGSVCVTQNRPNDWKSNFGDVIYQTIVICGMTNWTPTFAHLDMFLWSSLAKYGYQFLK